MSGKKLINQSLIYGVASLLINGSNFFLIPLYTHYLTTTEYGVISSVALFSTTTTAILTFGLGGSITRFFVEFNKEDFRNFIFSCFLFQVVVSVLICCLFIFFNGLFLDKIFAKVAYDPYLKYGLLIGLTSIFSAIPLAFLQAQSKAILYRVFTTSSFVFLTFFMIVFVVLDKKGSLGSLQATLLTNLLMAIVYSVFIISNSRFNFKWSYVSTALLFGIPIMVYAVFGVLLEVSSKFFIERFISLSELGVYNLAQQISSVMLMLTNAVNMAWVPMFYAEAKKNEASNLFASFGNLLIFGLTASGLGLALFSNEFVSLFMPVSYLSAAIYMPYLILAYIIGSGYWVVVVNPIGFSKKTIYLPILAIVSGIFSVALNFLLIPLIGAVGAAISTCASYFALVAIAYFIYRRHSAIQYDFTRMNKMVMIGIITYLISTQLKFDEVVINVVTKSLLFILFFILLQYLKIYSLTEIRNFVKSQSDQT